MSAFTADLGRVYLGKAPLSPEMITGLEALFLDAFNFAAVVEDDETAKAAQQLGYALEDATHEAHRQRNALASFDRGQEERAA